MDIWQLWHSQGGYEVELTDVPWWAFALSRVTEAVDMVTGHAFCGAGAPNLMWRIPLGRPVYDEAAADEEAFLTNSVAGALSDLFNWAACADIRYARSLHRFAVTEVLADTLGARKFSEEEDPEA